MRRFTGWLLLIALLGGFGWLMYEDMRLRNGSTEIPSAITAGTPEGPGDEPDPGAAALAPEAPAPAPADAGKASLAETPPASDTPARAVAAAEPPPTVELRAAADAPSASVDAPPSMQPSGGSDASTAPAPPSAEPAPPDAAGRSADAVAASAEPDASPADPPADVVAETMETPGPDPVPPEAPAPAPASVAIAPETAPSPAATPAEVAGEESMETPVPAAAPPEAPAAVAPEAPPSAPEPSDAATAANPAEAPSAPPAGTAVALPPESPSADGGAVVAAAPEIETEPQPGTTPPASESSGRDSMMQASPGPEPAPPVAETVIAAIDPAADVETPRPAAAPDSVPPGTDSETAAAPTFDVVRVEPTGDAVVAGVASPGARVDLPAGARRLPTTVASDTGDWAMALDRPLPGGPHDLGLRATSKDTGVVTESEQRVAILVPETVAEEPLVVLNAPNAASTLLQVPAAPQADSADVAAFDAPVAAATTPEGQESAASDRAATAAGSASPPPAAAAPEPIVAGPEPAVEVAAAEPPATSPAETADPAAAVAEADAASGAAPAAPAAAEPTTTGAAVAAPSPETAPAAQPEPEPVVAPVVAVTAVEAESSGALFVAGTATTPEDVRVYVDDVLLGEATPSPSGTWLIEVMREVPAGTYRVRADQVEPGAGTVLARAEVPFEREVEVAILRPVAEAGGGSGAEATGTMAGPTTLIIKRSDNLWRISRQLYGKGIRWSTIYEANKDQIRNPRFIYPGQVFILPEGNTEWSERDGAE